MLHEGNRWPCTFHLAVLLGRLAAEYFRPSNPEKDMKSLLVVFLFVSCAVAQDEAAVSRFLSACGPNEVKFEVTRNEVASEAAAQSDSNKALVLVIEEDKTSGLESITTRVAMDGQWIGANKGNSFMSFAWIQAFITFASTGHQAFFTNGSLGWPI